MKRRKRLACAWLVMASALSGCAEAPKPPEPEPLAPVRITPPPDYNITCVALSPDGKVLAYGLDSVPAAAIEASKPSAGRVVLCEAQTGKELLQLQGPDYAWPCEARFSPNGKRIVVGNTSKGVTLWEVATGKNRGDLEGTLSGGGSRLWTPDGALLVGGALRLDHGNTVDDVNYHLWSAEDGKEVRSLDFGGPWGRGGRFAFAADSRTIAVEHQLFDRVHPDQLQEKVYLYRWRAAVDLWDVNTGRRLGVVAGFSAPVEGYDAPPSQLPEVGAAAGQFRARALPGGRYLLLPTYDGYPALSMKCIGPVIVLSDALTGKEVRRFEDFKDGGIRTAVISSDGNVVAAAAQLAIGRSETAAKVWDVSDLCRTARRAAANLSAEQLAPLWDALADADATKAFPAMRLLALNPDRAVPLLKEHLRPVDDHPVPKWIADLNSDDFETREAASRGLAALGEAARPALEKTLAADHGPELRRRAEALLDKLKEAVAPEELRGVRAVDVLEQIGTDAARGVLKDLAAGAPGALTTQAAKDALARLDKVQAP